MNFWKRLFSRSAVTPKVDMARRFQLQEAMSKGSMSKVWKAIDTQSGRIVAVKVLDKEKTLKLEQRFVGMNRPREGEMAVTLSHPNIVRTFEHGLTSQDEQFLVMEFVEGASLTSFVELQNDRMRVHCLDYCIQLGEALDYLHSRQWIHRDLCPRNVLITRDDRVKLIDFGLMVPNTPPFRKPGNRTGTAAYMAPELIKRQPTDQRIDVYSYAMTCYEMFAGKLPWPAADTMEAVLQHVNSPPKPLQKFREDLDPQVVATVMKGLERHPDQRWQTIRQMVNEFQSAAKRLR